ncbi:MAG: hypothetical protein ACKVPY_12280 [Paracoccaceae bacterium]
MRPDDRDYLLFQLLHGVGRPSPLQVGKIPAEVSRALRWRGRAVFLTQGDAKKIRFHPMHGMNAARGIYLPLVIEHGDYYQTQHRGTKLQIEVVMHEPDDPKRAYFLVLARDQEDTGIFLRTFYFSAELSRSKMRRATVLRDASKIGYFKVK